MAVLEFQDFRFEELDKEIKVHFLKIFSFLLKKSELKKIGNFRIEKNRIAFAGISDEKAGILFSRLLNKTIPKLKNKLTNNPALYTHRNSGIPLIGSLSFGIVDKGTDMLELKPITSCNIDCVFCSVDEGISTKKSLDIVIEKDYLVQETKKLLEYKKQPVHIYINPHGEPLLYADIVELVRDLSSLRYVKAVSIITNAALLTEKLADELIEAGLTQLNVSINALNPEKAEKLAGTDSYDIKKIIKILSKIKNKIKIIITPVLIFGVNNKDIEDLIIYAKKNKYEILIQNFLINKRGRKPAKELNFIKFNNYLRELEKKYNTKLIKKEEINETKQLPKPLKKGDIIEAEIISGGRYNNECLAVAKERVITVKGYFTKRKKQKIKIIKDRYNVFYGIMV